MQHAMTSAMRQMSKFDILKNPRTLTSVSSHTLRLKPAIGAGAVEIDAGVVVDELDIFVSCCVGRNVSSLFFWEWVGKV